MSAAGTWTSSPPSCGAVSSSGVARRRRPGGELGPLPEAVGDLVDEDAAMLEPATRSRLCELILREAVGLGPLEELLADPAVEEVMVNGHDRVYVERGGQDRARRGRASRPSRRCATRSSGSWRRSGAGSTSSARWSTPASRTARASTSSSRRSRSTGRRSRSAASRRFGRGPRELVELGTLTEELHDELAAAVGARRSILVSGGTGSGKTTLLNALSASSSRDERVVTIEDAAELRLRQPHVVRLESRPASVEGRGRGDASATCCATRCACARTGS